MKGTPIRSAGDAQQSSAAPPAPGGLTETLGFCQNCADAIHGIVGVLGSKMGVYSGPGTSPKDVDDSLPGAAVRLNSQLNEILSYLTNVNSAV